MFPSRLVSVLGKGALENNYSLDFDGTDDYVEVGDVGSIKSLVFWFKPASEITSSSSARSLFAFRDHASDKYYGVHTGASTGVISGEVLSILPDSTSRTGTNTTLNAGQWYHFAVVWNSSSNYFDIYTDGTLTTDLSSGTHSLTNWTEFRIGRDFGFYSPINCNIDEVAIWDAALSDADVLSIYNLGVPNDLTDAESYDTDRTGGLVGYWRFEEGTGTSLADSSTNSNTGTLNNSDDDEWSTSTPS